MPLQLAGMTKTPYPLLDPVMVGPFLLCLNTHFSLLPDLLLLSLVAVSTGHTLSITSLSLSLHQVYAVFDVTQTCVMSIHQICWFMDIPCFSVPATQLVGMQGSTQPRENSPKTASSHSE